MSIGKFERYEMCVERNGCGGCLFTRVALDLGGGFFVVRRWGLRYNLGCWYSGKDLDIKENRWAS